MLTVYIVWAMEVSPKSRDIMQFCLRPQLVTLDGKFARRFASGMGASTVSVAMIPKPEGWIDDRDG